MLIALDAGHGLYTAGRRCLKSLDPGETREWALNHRVACYVARYLADYDCDILRTDDPTGAEDVTLEARVSKANLCGADAFISIHHNAGIKGGSGGGVVAYTCRKCSAVSTRLRDVIYERTVYRTGLSGNRSAPRQSYDYYVLKHTKMPAVLIECGFMDSSADVPVILSEAHAEEIARGITDALVEVLGLEPSNERGEAMKYVETDGVMIAEVPVSEFKILLLDAPKRSMGVNRCNGGFFGNFEEGADCFTLPVGHVVCDYAADSRWTRHYCEERGSFDGDKFAFNASTWPFKNSLYGHQVSTLVVADGRAEIVDTASLPLCEYAISGVPVVRGGGDCKFTAYVKAQGWGATSLRATWHVFVGLKEDRADTVFVMGMRTKTSNMIKTSEAYKVFSAMGFRDVIKLDGGGSFFFDAAGRTKRTSGNRRICTVLELGTPEVAVNPYPTPCITLFRGSNLIPAYNKWLQWELNAHGYSCEVDGRFGAVTQSQLKSYQADHGLDDDGRCGKATRTSFLN